MKTFRKLFFTFVLCLLVPSAWGMLVLQLNLNQLTALADTVFVGTVSSVVQEHDAEGRPIQKVTFDVSETLKGTPAPQVTFRQLGMADHSLTGAERATVGGLDQELPKYEVGEESVIFLSEPGQSGLTAPIGLSQGKFAVTTDSSGQKAVANGMGNQGLFLGWDKSPGLKAMSLNPRERAMTHTTGKALKLDDFSSLVRKLAAQ